MQKLGFAAFAALLASTAMVQAGGVERTTQSIGMIFEEGSYAEFSLSFVAPTVTGEFPATVSTGDMANDYFSFSGGYKTDIGEKIGLAVIFDQPFGADSAYSEGTYSGVNAQLSSSAVTVLASYDLSDRFVVYGGGVVQEMSAKANVPLVLDYSASMESTVGYGYVVGAAFQIPDIALRVALTYRSDISASYDTTEYSSLLSDTTTVTNVSTPQSVNLEFQTGVNPKTLAFGAVRWVQWSQFEIDPPDYPSPTPLVGYDADRIQFSLGVGRKLSETLSAAVTIGYEKTLDGPASILAPSSGNFSVGGGVTYDLGGAEITAGAKYLWLGDVVDDNGGIFENNSALAFGVKVSKAF